jgi:hypothetical protein
MIESPKVSYVRRPKGYRTFDSICLSCFRTVMADANEQQLDDAEGLHACDPRHLEALGRQRTSWTKRADNGQRFFAGS